MTRAYVESFKVKLSVDHHTLASWLASQWGEGIPPRGYPLWWVTETKLSDKSSGMLGRPSRITGWGRAQVLSKFGGRVSPAFNSLARKCP